MLIPLRDQNGMIIPTTAEGVRSQARIPNPGGDFPANDQPNPRTPMPGNMPVPGSMGGMTDIAYQPPKQQAALPGAGDPFAAMTDIPYQPRQQSTPKSDMLNPIAPGEPARLMTPPGGERLPIDVQSEPAPAGPGATPLTSAEPNAEPNGVDIRQYLKIAGVTMLRSPSPAERAQGMQMLFEATQPTPGEVARAERERMRDVVGRANVDPDLQHAAGIAADLGGNAELLMKTMQLDPESRAKKEATKKHAAEVLDKAYAPKYVEFKLQDQSGMSKSIAQLVDVQTLLQQPGMKITGPVIGAVPDSLKAFFPAGQRAITARELTEEVIQQSLRQILGAQFTQKEGESLMARTFNDKLSPEENLLRGQRLLTQIVEAYTDQTNAAQYFEENGTLAGFKGRPVPTLADIENRAREEATHPARTGQTGRQVQQGGKQSARPDLSDEVILQQAQEAMAKGKNPEVIKQRLRDWGVQVQ